MHTTHSDGRLTPTHLVDLLAANGLRYASITDHDTTGSWEEASLAAREYPQLTLIPGIELSTEAPGGEAHVLAYYVNPADPHLQVELSKFRGNREDRGRTIINRLAELGVPVAWERVLEFANGGSVGRPHIGRAMVERGYVANLQEAFDKYLGRNGLAYIEREKVTPQDAVRLALNNGALPVLAHPSYVGGLDLLLPDLKDAGLLGMEVYYKSYSPQTVAHLEKLAKKYHLIPCGGSDYHANGEVGEVLPGSAGPPISTIEQLGAVHAERQAARR